MNSIPQRSDDACESSQAGDSLLLALPSGVLTARNWEMLPVPVGAAGFASSRS